MASFTDSLVAFNPYVAQTPVDDYTRVGLIKQEQYNQGVKTVQGYIDSIAGIEALKPEQKDYISQRINNLQQEVGKVVQADFSSQQLINSIGSLTSKIAADPIVKNTVASTDNYRAELAAIQDAKAKGKSSVSNEWDFNDQFQKWYSDGDVKTRFTGRFTPYTDVTSKISKIIKDLDPNSHIEDNPFKRGGDGQILLDKDGLPQIDFAMIEKGSKGLTPERISAAIQANLTQDDLNQLTIDGRYSYRGMDAMGMKQITDQSYQHKLDQTNDIIQGLMVAKQTVNNNPQKAAEIDARIQAYKDKAEGYQKSYRQDIATINSNLEGYKGSMYAQSWLNKFSDGYAYTQESLTYKENPYFMAAERRRENDIKFNEFVLDRQFKAADLELKKEQLKISWYNAETSRMGVQAKVAKTAHGALEGIPLSDAILEPIPQETIDQINEAYFIKQTADISDEIDQQKMALLGNTGLVTIKRDPTGKNPRYEYNVYGKDPEVVKKAADAAIAKLKDAYDKDPNSVDPGTRTYFKNLANADQTVQNSKYSLNQVQREADKEYPLGPVLSKIPPMRITTGSGEQFYLSPQEQLNFNTKLSSVIKSTSVGVGGPSVPYYDNEAASKLFVTPAEKMAYEAMWKEAHGRPMSPAEKQIATRLGDVQMKANIPARGIIARRDTYINNAVKSIVGVQQPVSFTLEAFKAEDRNRAKAIATNLLASMSREGKGSPGANFDRGDAQEMLKKANDDNTNYSLVSLGRGQSALRMTNEDVNKKGIDIPLTKQQAEELFGQGKFLDDFYNIRQSLQLTKNTGKWTTDVRNLGKDGAFNLDNGLLNKYSVKYHVEDPLKNGGLQVRMYIYDKSRRQWLPERTAGFGQLINEAQVTDFLSKAGDQYIDALLQSDK